MYKPIFYQARVTPLANMALHKYLDKTLKENRNYYQKLKDEISCKQMTKLLEVVKLWAKMAKYAVKNGIANAVRKCFVNNLKVLGIRAL